MNIFKIGSGEAINYPLIRKIKSFKKKTIISTGMCTLEEVEKIVMIFKGNLKNLILLHCTSLYPCPDDECNLLSIIKMKKKFTMYLIDVVIVYDAKDDEEIREMFLKLLFFS